MMDAKDKAKQFGLSSLSGWELAELFGCHFTGDVNPLRHGGTFYEADNWERYGYAFCVSFADVDGKLLVEAGTINRPKDMAPCFKCCGIAPKDQNNIHAQIESALGYWGLETDEDFSGRYSRWFEERCDVYTDDDTDLWVENDGTVFETEDSLLESLSGWIKGLTS